MEISQNDYSKNGMQTRVWGPAGWIFLHCIAQNYPQEPTEEQKIEYMRFFRCIGNVLPCRYCRESYKDFIGEQGTLLDYSVMKNRNTFTKWLYKVHNKINKKLGIKNCVSFEQVTEKYESFRSKCTKSHPTKEIVKGARTLQKRVHCVKNVFRYFTISMKMEMKFARHHLEKKGTNKINFHKKIK